MEQDLLFLTPKRFLCPYCGKWHKWEKWELGYYDSENYRAELECSDARIALNNGGYYEIYFYNDYLYYSIKQMCCRTNQKIEGKIPISSITESADQPIVTFEVPFITEEDVGSRECYDCGFKRKCVYAKLGDKCDNRHMTITFGFEFDKAEYEHIAKAPELARKEKEQKELEERERALEEPEKAIESKEKGSKQLQKNKEKEKTAMENIFNINAEFGPNKDPNIASTLMGIAVRDGLPWDGEPWRIYDKKKKEIIDIGDMQLGNLPIFILPTTKLSEGDLIKDDDEYYYVINVEAGSTQTMCAKTGEMKTVVPIKNILGFSCYSKVIALSDSLDIGAEFDMETLAIMSAMCGGQSTEEGGQMNNLMPLLLFKDKLGGDGDMSKLLLVSAMMPQEEGGDQAGQMSSLLPLLLFKDKIGGDDDTTKLLLASSMMGGNMAGSSNPMMSYLMLDTFLGKKEEKETAQAAIGTSDETAGGAVSKADNGATDGAAGETPDEATK